MTEGAVVPFVSEMMLALEEFICKYFLRNIS
jgi:hypothetical protein